MSVRKMKSRTSVVNDQATHKPGTEPCCIEGGPVRQACHAGGLPETKVREMLKKAASSTSVADRKWAHAPLADLIGHVVGAHHKYTRDEIARLRPLLDKVCSIHGMNHPELESVRTGFTALAEELTVHMMKEELILFPYIERMEESTIQKEPIVPPMFVTVQNPVAMMMSEHDSAEKTLQVMREVSGGYSSPRDACVSFALAYQVLEDFEADLRQHIHLENDILFPRAIAMERGD